MRSTNNLLAIMHLHIDALYRQDCRQRLVGSNDWRGGDVPRFFLGRTKTGNVWRMHADLADSLVAELAQLCQDEPPLADAYAAPVHAQAYARLLAEHAPVSRIGAGPAYWLPAAQALALAPAQDHCVPINAASIDLLRGGFEEWLDDVPHQQPFLAALEDGRAVAVCASVRITPEAHEAGVETLPAHRRRGHAAAVVQAWAQAAAAQGVLPLYSTSWENVASQGVAARVGAMLIGADFQIA